MLAGVLAVAGLLMIAAGSPPPGAPPPPPAAAGSAVAAGAAARPAELAVPGPPGTLALPATPVTPLGAPQPAPSVGLARSVPVHLDIPAIGVHTALMEVGRNPDGSIAVPPLRRDAPAGWYRHLATPGEVGPAVIVGHVDTARDGPAVFFRLGALRPGTTIAVRRADGGVAVFVVQTVAQYPKAAFPNKLVYGPVDYPALRLITCGGTFDAGRRRYLDNIVVFAELTGTRQTGNGEQAQS